MGKLNACEMHCNVYFILFYICIKTIKFEQKNRWIDFSKIWLLLLNKSEIIVQFSVQTVYQQSQNQKESNISYFWL